MKIGALARLWAYTFLAGCSGDPTGSRDGDPLVIAHRGASYVAPEHTVASYDRAVAQGADYIEQDVARTADGVLVVIHDATLERTARGPAADCTGAVREKTLEQLRRCDFGAWFNELFPGRASASYEGLDILTLQETIIRYRDRVGLYVEIKNPELYPGIEAELAQLFRAAGVSFDRRGRPSVFVQSFSAESLKRLHTIDRDIPLVLLLQSGTTPTPALFADIATYADAVAPSVQSDIGLATALAQPRGLSVHVYGVDGAETVASLLRSGVDGLIVDRPDVVREVIFSR